MNIYIDESGSFVNASTVGAWNAVAAFAVPEAARKKLDQLLDQLKRSDRHGGRRETKINNLTEDAYLQFIEKLAELNAVVFCTATDAGLNTKTGILKHQYKQAKEIRKHIEKLRYAGGRQGVLLMASRL